MSTVSNSNGVNSNIGFEISIIGSHWVSNSNGVNSNFLALVLKVKLFASFKLQRSKF